MKHTSVAEYRRLKAGGKRPWSNAKKTTCAALHSHPSKVEARVCDRLRDDVLREEGGAKLVRNVRLPLIASTLFGCVPLSMTVDFAVYSPSGKLLRLIDAKSGRRRSRDWARGKAVLEASFGVTVEEMSS